MKKTFLILLLFLVSFNIIAQKKKTATKKANTSLVLAKSDNISAEIVKNNFYLFVSNGKKKDTITLKSVDSKSMPTDCKITIFTAKSTSLCLVTWTEKSNIKTPTKSEDITLTYSEIYEIASKTKSFSNVQTNSKIKEQVFLDKLKNASETQEKVHNEGFIFSLSKDGEVTLNTKKQENKMVYDPVSKKYIDAKKKK